MEKEYPAFELYNKNFSVLPKLEKELIDYAEKEGLEYVEEDFEKSKDMIRLLTKAYIARDLWEVSEFFQIYNPVDPIFIKAIEVSQNEKLYEAKLQTYVD